MTDRLAIEGFSLDEPNGSKRFSDGKGLRGRALRRAAQVSRSTGRGFPLESFYVSAIAQGCARAAIRGGQMYKRGHGRL